MTTGSQKKGRLQPKGEPSLNVLGNSSAVSSIEEPKEEGKSALQAQPCHATYAGECNEKRKLLRLQPSLPTLQQQRRNEDVANVPPVGKELPLVSMPSQLWRPYIE